VIETARLVLRPFRDDDLDPFAAMMADPRVADWLGGVRTRAQCAASLRAWADEWQHLGYGLLALTHKTDDTFVGMAGLHALDGAYDPTPVAGATEIAWRLAFAAWGQGYAVEAALAVVGDGLERAGLAEIVAFTAECNHRSQAVMTRSGFVRQADRDFDHPNLPPAHPLRRHVVSAISRT
jgi:RimJ/RimL family protein N-acetyltransferase